MDARGIPPSPDQLRPFGDALAQLPTGQGRFERVLRGFVRGGVRVAGWRLEVRGLERLPRGTGPTAAGCLVVPAPHRAWVEPFLLLLAWPPDAARLVWLADGRTVVRSWWRRRVLPHVGVIPVGGDLKGPQRTIALAQAVLAAGGAVVIFPEVGPPSPPDHTRRISPGFAYVAVATGAPVIPVVIGGSHRIVRGSPFSLEILAPIEPGPPEPEALGPAARDRAHDLASRYAAFVNGLLPAHTALADARAPERARWRWLGRLFR